MTRHEAKLHMWDRYREVEFLGILDTVGLSNPAQVVKGLHATVRMPGDTMLTFIVPLDKIRVVEVENGNAEGREGV